MSARERILTSVRKHHSESSPLPDLEGPWIVYPDPVAQFASVLETIGGTRVRVATQDAIPQALAGVVPYAAARRVVSCVPGLGIRADELSTVDDPHTLADVDFAILRGRIGVAENAAIWVTDQDLKHRAIYFLCHHLALVISAGQIVSNLHEAYRQIRFDAAQFGAFISGPSKTADIEQSLVIGAHGPKSLTVFVIG